MIVASVTLLHSDIRAIIHTLLRTRLPL
jgi:hypothetical protein